MRTWQHLKDYDHICSGADRSLDDFIDIKLEDGYLWHNPKDVITLVRSCPHLVQESVLCKAVEGEERRCKYYE